MITQIVRISNPLNIGDLQQVIGAQVAQAVAKLVGPLDRHLLIDRGLDRRTGVAVAVSPDPGRGQIAVQVPSNHNHISHQICRETASEEMFTFILNGFQRYAPVLSIDDYARLFFDCGAEDIVVFEKIYAHVLEDSDAVVEWISGTALVPYFERIGKHKDAFVQSIREKMRAAMPDRPVFYPFRRTFFSARKPK